MNNHSESFSIKSWAEDDRPREKLIHKGSRALSDAELIAILIGSGNRDESAVALSKRILASVGNKLSEIASLSVNDLMRFKGIGEAKAISIVTALELGRRRKASEATKNDIIKSSRDVYELMHPIIGELNHEEFWVFFLNNAQKIKGRQNVSKGGIASTLVDVRMIFKSALEHLATSIVLCHNHPSGNPTPSEHDINLTKKLVQGGKVLDIKVLDHIIVTPGSYYSFANENML